MKYTKEEAKERYPGVNFCGQIFYIGDRARIGVEARIGDWAIIGAWASIGARAIIGDWAIIGDRASIGVEARIGDRARIGVETRIATVCSKYVGNIVPMKDRILIRFGCETHSAEDWKRKGENYAKKHNETDYWNKSGKNIINLLIAEAEVYQREYKQV